MPEPKRILISVQDGLVQEVFVTSSVDARIVLIDWDNIREGDPTSPWCEWNPTVMTDAEFDDMLSNAESEFKDRHPDKAVD